jgi:hypothetical protein
VCNSFSRCDGAPASHGFRWFLQHSRVRPGPSIRCFTQIGRQPARHRKPRHSR